MCSSDLHALELGRGLLALGLGRVALDVPVDYEAPHVHLLFDAEVQAELGLHVVSPVWSGGGIPFGPPAGGPCKAEGHGWDGQSLRRHRERDVGGARDGVRGLPAGGPKGRSTFGWGDGASGFAWRGVAVPTRQYVVVLGVATRVVPVPLNGAKGYSEVSCALTHLAVRVILSPLEDWYPHARTTSVARPFGKVFRLFGA